MVEPKYVVFYRTEKCSVFLHVLNFVCLCSINSNCDLPVRWLPPETLSGDQYMLQSDVWQFGVTMWEIFSMGMKPYGWLSNREVIDHVLQGNVLKKECVSDMTCRVNGDGNYPDDIYNFMKRCWSHHPADRPSFTNLQDSELISDVSESVFRFYSYQNIDSAV